MRSKMMNKRHFHFVVAGIAIVLVLLPTSVVSDEPTSCSYMDVTDEWLVYRVPYKTTVPHDLYITKRIVISLLEEGDPDNGIPDKLGIVGLEGDNETVVFEGRCNSGNGVYEVAGFVRTHDCDHKIKIERGDNHANSYYPQCDAVPKDKINGCKEYTKSLHEKHLTFTYPRHRGDETCVVKDPGDHGGTAHGGND